MFPAPSLSSQISSYFSSLPFPQWQLFAVPSRQSCNTMPKSVTPTPQTHTHKSFRVCVCVCERWCTQAEHSSFRSILIICLHFDVAEASVTQAQRLLALCSRQGKHAFTIGKWLLEVAGCNWMKIGHKEDAALKTFLPLVRSPGSCFSWKRTTFTFNVKAAPFEM